jgi:spoIIIJ-associated protein
VTNQLREDPRPEMRDSRSSTEAVADFCRKVLAQLGLDLEVSAIMRDETITVNVSGTDRPVLLAATAALLNSLEYLVNKAFRTGAGEEIGSIVLDSDDYRRHREAELILLAQMASQKVLAQRRPLSLQPMTPKERRIIHLALADTEGIRTESAGEGENRSITIFPS